MITHDGNGEDGGQPPRDDQQHGGASGADTLAARREAQASEARELALAIAGVALDLKALNVEIIDVRGKVDYSDYVVVMSGRSDRQAAALARNIEAKMDSKGVRCIGVEGMPQATWLLMDYGDVIVHIFHQDTRGYYDLETLWIDAARVEVEGQDDDHPGAGDSDRVRG